VNIESGGREREPYYTLAARRVFDEFPPGAADPIEVPANGISRRRFLALASASAALALGTVSCSRIDRGTIVPYTKKPQEVHPGVANYYASTFQEGLVAHGVLVKTREGRPIHVEGNDEDPIWRGKAGMRAIGDILGLYDPDRLRGPVADGSPSSWQKADAEIVTVLRRARTDGKPVLLLTEAVLSPTKAALIRELNTALPTLRHAAWEPAASQPELAATRSLFQMSVVPQYRFDRARVILSLQADLLGTDARAAVFIQDCAARRVVYEPTHGISRLWVAEGVMSLTGANADHRLQVPPSRIASLAFALARELHESYGLPLPEGVSADRLGPFALDTVAHGLPITPGLLKALVQDLKQAGEAAVVIAGAEVPPETHIACHLLNAMLGAEGHTVNVLSAPAAPDVLTVTDLRQLLEDVSNRTFAAAVFWGTNPAYAFPDSSLWQAAVSRVPLTVRIGLHEDETALGCRWRLPEHHWLESWGDFASSPGTLRLRQPTIGAIHNTRQGEDILLAWLQGLGVEVPRSYLAYLKERWEKEVYPSGSPVPFQMFWNAALHDGILRRADETWPRSAEPPGAVVERLARPEAYAEAIAAAAAVGRNAVDQFELVLHPAASLFDGRYANNGWLQELPDPVTKATWTNPLLLSTADANRLSISDNDLVRITTGSATAEAPVLVQPGQTPGVVVLSLGFGRRTGSVASGAGTNAYPLADMNSGAPYLTVARLARTSGSCTVARTEEHNRVVAGRDFARRWTVAEYAGRPRERESELASLIPDPKFPGHKWGMVIDLSACVGCSACVVACQSENNSPVVGPDQVIKGREMHWMRIDRTYAGDPEDPSVLHQPILCQQCDDAPCEIVCPVNATTHSPDGLNQMAYNRCVGTRYCSNNCPFKVRHFNYFDYASMKREPEILVFNPEVTVRPRGVMEKCTFCVQRIQDVRQRANVEHRSVRDGEIKPACAVACPSEAIVFGDLNDPNSRVATLAKTDRGYRLLRGLGIKPSVTYLADIANPAFGEGRA
jgi:Fe-S-cluster-containing dehydrogenase component/anaerobic selenocysteine-containing dehydrogenase